MGFKSAATQMFSSCSSDKLLYLVTSYNTQLLWEYMCEFPRRSWEQRHEVLCNDNNNNNNNNINRWIRHLKDTSLKKLFRISEVTLYCNMLSLCVWLSSLKFIHSRDAKHEDIWSPLLHYMHHNISKIVGHPCGEVGLTRKAFSFWFDGHLHQNAKMTFLCVYVLFMLC